MNAALQKLSVRIRNQHDRTIGSGLLYITERQDYAYVLTAAHVFDNTSNNTIYPIDVQCYPDDDAIPHKHFCFSVCEEDIIIHERYHSATTQDEKMQYDMALIRLPRKDWMDNRAKVFFDHAQIHLKVEGFGYAANSLCKDICLDVISFTPEESRITNMSNASHCMGSILKGDFDVNHANRAQEIFGFSGTAIAAANLDEIILIGFAVSIQQVNGLLGKFTLIDVYPVEELLKAEGIECIWKSIAESELQSCLPTQTNISSTRFFVHRESEMKDMQQKLLHVGTVVLTGIGGIGKTGLARHYASINKNAYSQCAFIPCSGSIASGIANSVKINGIQRRHISGRLESDEELSLRVLDAMLRQASNTWLLIFDNTSPRDPLICRIKELSQHIIITSRWNAQEWHFPVIDISALAEIDSQRDLFNQYLGREISENEMDDFRIISTITSGHTLTLQLIALQCAESDMSLSEIRSVLTANSIYTDNPDEFTYDESGVERNMYGHIRALWNLTDFSDEESRIMQGLSLLTPNGITRREYKQWLELESMRSINLLRKQGWIQTYSQGEHEMIFLHTVIGEVILRELYQTNAADLSAMLHALNLKVNNRNMDAVEQSRYISYGMSVGKRIKPSEEAFLLLNLTGLHLEYFRRLDDAIGILTYAENLLHQTNSEQSVLGGHTQNNLAVVYHTMLDFTQARYHFEKAAEIYRRCGNDTKGNLGYALHNIAKLAYHTDKPEEALQIEAKAEPLIRKHMIVHLGELFDVRRECYRRLVYREYEQYERLSNSPAAKPFLLHQLQRSIEEYMEAALTCGELAIDYKRQYNPTDEYEIMSSFGDHAANKAQFRHDPQAATEIQEVLSFFIRTTGEQSEHTGHTYDKMCLIYENLGYANRACEYGSKAIDILSQCLGSNHEAVETAKYNLQVAITSLR